jgi:hypothetical protein
MGDDLIPVFWVGDFKFRFLHSFVEEDIYIYEVSKGQDFRMPFFVLGVDVSGPTGVLCNVDFVHFVWNHFESTSHKRYALTVIPSGFTEGEPRLLCLKYYRTASDGWKDGTNCDSCVAEDRQSLRAQTGCLSPRACFCNICVRQPPKLFDLAHHVFSELVSNLQDFDNP